MGQVTGGTGVPGLGDMLIELAGVQAGQAHPQAVAGPAGRQHLARRPVRAARGQGLPQPGDVPLQPGRSGRGRLLTPDPGDQVAVPDRMPGPGGQHAEHGLPPRPADPDFPLAPPGPYRAEQFKP